MYRREFERYDFRLKLYEDSDGTWWVEGSAPELGRQSAPIDLEALNEATQLIGEIPVHVDAPAIPDHLELYRQIGRHLFDAVLGGPINPHYSSWLRVSPQGNGIAVFRLALGIEVSALNTLPWELMRDPADNFLQTHDGHPVLMVRMAPRPRAASEPLSLPIRVIQLDLDGTEPEVDVPEMIADVFRSTTTGLPHEQMASIFQTERRPIFEREDLISTLRESGQVDIVHLTGVQSHHIGNPQHHLAAPAPLLDNLMQILDQSRTRLLVLQADTRDWEAQPSSLQFAQLAVAGRGGPPVLVSHHRLGGTRDFYARFYGELIHDAPLDIARLEAERYSDQMGQTALITGPQGEELLRLSTMLPRAYRRRDEAQARVQQVTHTLDQLRAQADRLLPPEDPGREALATGDKALASIEGAANVLDGYWPLDWEHESTSSIPMVRNLARLEDFVAEMEAVEASVETAARAMSAASETTEFAPAPKTLVRHRDERHVNTWLEDWNTEEKVPEKDHLWLHRAYRLHVDIGPHAEESSVRNPIEIPEEALEPIYRRGGDWVHVAVYSQDFDIAIEKGPPEGGYHQRPYSAMQRLWLPANLASQPVYFTLRPLRPGLAYLRICIYYRNQLLQSLRMDARVWGRRGDGIGQLPEIDAAQVASLGDVGIRALEDVTTAQAGDLQNASGASWRAVQGWIWAAKALLEVDDSPLQEIPGIGPATARSLTEAGLAYPEDLATAGLETVAEMARVSPALAREWVKAAERLPQLGYQTFIEYTISADFQKIERLSQRRVSIFANQMGSTQFVGVKLGEWDEAWGTEDDWTDAIPIPEDVITSRLPVIREYLEKISTDEQNAYAFASMDLPDLTPPKRINTGDREQLERILKELARKGRELYHEIFSKTAKRKLREVLKEPAQTVHIARVMDGEVLPWAILYDQDLTVAQEPEKVCFDLLNHVDNEGRLDYRSCADQASCPLRADNRRRIVCPWGFWGIKHILEQPPQRITERAKPRDLITELEVTGSINLSMNVSTRLNLLDSHYERMSQLPGITQPLVYAGDDRPKPDQPSPESGDNQVLKALQNTKLHVIYFYCHGGATDEFTGPGWLVPYLSVGRTIDQRITPDDLEECEWIEHPLVFVNGCHTAGLEPRILGGFVRTFAESGAAGVIGTEIKVWEPLATFVAESFFEAFLAGQPVGQILRDLRHELLRRYNPLGLVYTNYCSADLKLERTKR